MKKPFCPMVPAEAMLRDKNITPRLLRVLLALYTFADQKGNCYPKRAHLADMCGMREAEISRATTDLQRLGWLTKTGNGGRNTPARYRLHPPQTVQDSCTVSEPQTVQESCTVSPQTVQESCTVSEPETVQESCTKTVQESCTRIKHTNEHTSTSSLQDEVTRVARARAKPKADTPPCPHDVPAELYAEWLDYRRAKGAKPLWSARAEALMRGGAQRAGISLAEAMEYTMARTWQGFYAETYLRDEKPQQNGARQFKTAREIDDERAADLWNAVTGGRMGAKKETAQIIDVAATYREPLQLLEKTG